MKCFLSLIRIWTLFPYKLNPRSSVDIPSHWHWKFFYFFFSGGVCLFVLCRKKKNTCQTFQKFQTGWWWSCCYLKTESKWQPYRRRQHWWRRYLRQRRRVARHTIKLQSRRGWPMPMLHSCFAGRHNWNQAQPRHSRQQCPPSQMTWLKPCKRSPWEDMTPSSFKTLPSTGLSLSLPHSSSCTIISCLCIISKYPAMSSKIVFLMFSHKTFILWFLLCGSVLVPWGWKNKTGCMKQRVIMGKASRTSLMKSLVMECKFCQLQQTLFPCSKQMQQTSFPPVLFYSLCMGLTVCVVGFVLQYVCYRVLLQCWKGEGQRRWGPCCCHHEWKVSATHRTGQS